MSGSLPIFSLQGPPDLRYTHLTRLEGEAPDLPPLAQWLGLEALDTDQIELFPISDLGAMSLSVYLQSAFDPEPAALEASAPYIDAAQGSVLIIPEAAMTGTLAPNNSIERIAGLPLLRADHSADLPKADLSTPAATPEALPDQPAPTLRRIFMVVLAALLSLLLVLVWYLT